jgi:hypothetical protein
MFKLILHNDNWHIYWNSPRQLVSWRKWLFAIFLKDKHKRYNWLIRFCGLDIGRCYKETQEQTVLRLRQAGCTCPQPLIGYHGEKIRCRLCNKEEK